VATLSQAHAGEVSLAVNGSGVAIAVWSQLEGEGGAPPRLWVTWSEPSGGWARPEVIAASSTTGSLDTITVALDGARNAVILWSSASSSGSGGIVAVRHRPGQGWAPSERLSDRGGAQQVAMDGMGRSLAAWSEGATAVAAAHDLARGWSTPVRFGPGVEGNFYEGSLALDASGRGVLAWERRAGGVYGPAVVWSTLYDGSTWGPGIVISDPKLKSYFPRVAMTRSGGMAAWTVLGFPDRTDGAAASQFDFGEAWRSPTSIASGEGALTPDLASNVEGNAFATWSHLEPKPIGNGEKWYRLRACRYAGRTWGPAEPLQVGPGDAQYPRAVVDAQGNAVIVWLENEGALGRIWANRFEITGR
jgi:hypothetical protein